MTPGLRRLSHVEFRGVSAEGMGDEGKAKCDVARRMAQLCGRSIIRMAIFDVDHCECDKDDGVGDETTEDVYAEGCCPIRIHRTQGSEILIIMRTKKNQSNYLYEPLLRYVGWPLYFGRASSITPLCFRASSITPLCFCFYRYLFYRIQ